MEDFGIEDSREHRSIDLDPLQEVFESVPKCHAIGPYISIGRQDWRWMLSEFAH